MNKFVAMVKAVPYGYWTPTVFGLVFVAIATAHRVQLDDPGYIHSFLIPVEMTLTLLMFLMIPIQLVIGIVLLIRRKWNSLLVLVINIAASIVLVLSGMFIDSPTIIYMT